MGLRNELDRLEHGVKRGLCCVEGWAFICIKPTTNSPHPIG